MRKCYLISLIWLTILIVIVGIMLGISFLNLRNKEIFKSDFFQKELIKKDNNALINNENENEKNETIIESKAEDAEKATEKIENIEVTNEIENQINDVINYQLYVLWNKHSISEIENSEKVQVAFELYKKSKNVKYLEEPEIDASLIENYYSQSLISELPFYHEDLKTHIFLSYPGLYSYLFDKDKNDYIKQVDGCDFNVVMPASQKIFSLYKINNQIILQMKYIWMNHPDMGPITKLYKNYDDAQNMNNEIWSTDFDGYSLTPYENYRDYIKNNMDYLYSFMETYNYVFELKDNEYKLTDFYRN